MPTTQTLKITVADDMEQPEILVYEALMRYVHDSYPVGLARFVTPAERALYEDGVLIELVD
jgi:hypothetical protein